jgi:fatty-acyl-CoA synthase
VKLVVLAGDYEFESFLAHGNPNSHLHTPIDEWEAISLNYTSGTTGNPKGVVTHHRGAYLKAMGTILCMSLPPHFKFLWTLPMFHCNGWCVLQRLGCLA